MSRFSPDTWIDAIQLPFAMMQFKGNVYVEPISPDARPVFFILITIIACIVVIIKVLRKKPFFKSSENKPRLAIVAATLLALVSWIMTSGNGRYGLLVLTLCPLAGLAALIMATSSNKIRALILAPVVAIQALFIFTADPDDTWSRLTLYRWNESNADSLPAEMVAKWKEISEKRSTLVVTTKTLTGMSILYAVFGERAKYMGLAHIDQQKQKGPEYSHAVNMINAADVIYLSRAVAAKPKTNIKEVSVRNPTTNAEQKLLNRFGLMADEQCVQLPERLGAQLQICPVTRVPLEPLNSEQELAQKPLGLLNILATTCPNVFGQFRRPLDDTEGGIVTNTHDGKYFVEITKSLDVYIRHRSEIEHRLLISRDQLNLIESKSCSSLMDAGHQYWR